MVFIRNDGAVRQVDVIKDYDDEDAIISLNVSEEDKPVEEEPTEEMPAEEKPAEETPVVEKSGDAAPAEAQGKFIFKGKN